jgi:CHAT domain-containing protein/Tfp pilus assembly protein PilF
MGKSRHIIVWVVLAALLFWAPAAEAAKDEAERLWELGEKAYEASRYNDALSYYNRSLALCAGNQECVASNLNGIGAVYEAQDDDKTAFKYYQDALAAARKAKNRDLIATNLFNTGAVYHRTFHQYEKALGLFEESLKMFRDLNDRKSAAIVLFNMGKVLNALGRSERALAVLNESLAINRSMNNEQAIAGNLNVMGNVYANLGQYDKLLSLYQEALRINRRLKNPGETATSLTNIGDAYCSLIERDKAIPYYQEALEIQKRHNLRFGLAITHTNLGALYKDLDQFDKALSHNEEALKLARALDDTAMIATILNNTGNVHASLGRSDTALSYYQQSLKLDRQLNRPRRIAVTLNNIGMEYFRLGRYDQALSYLREALGIERKLDNPHDIAARLNNIGAVYLRQKRYGDAEEALLERRNLGRRITKTRLIHAGLVEVYLATHRYDEALSLLRELPPSWRDNRNRRLEYHTQYGLALRGKGALKESARELLKAVSIVEEIRRDVSDRSAFFAGGGYIGRLTPYRELMAVLVERVLAGESRDDEFRAYGRDLASSAFYFGELAKARTLLERMADAARKYEDPQIPPDVRRREAGLLRELKSIESRRERAFTEGEAAFKRLARQEEELVGQLDALVSDLRKHYPLYAAIHYPKPTPAEDLPLKEGEVLVEFGVSDRTVVVFVVRKGGVGKIYRIPVRGEELAAKVKTFMDPLSSGRYSELSIASAAELYRLLLSEAAKEVRETERLILVPDGILGLLPFEALVVKEGKDYGDCLYAGDRWKVTYAQSATSLALTRLLERRPAGRTLFAIGNPVYDPSDPRYVAYRQGVPAPPAGRDQKQYAYRGVTVVAKPGAGAGAVAWEDVSYPALPETEDEIREIARLFGVRPEPPDILLGLSASETQFKKADLEAYRYIHFATHADLPGKIRGIGEPVIILGQVENRRGDDGFLTLSEVLGLKLNADLVVLSACSTGKGDLMEGEGVSNFARAFEHAGARGVVVSLWEVASEAAVGYMVSFYSQIKAGKGKAEALRLARRDIRAKYPHPFFWSVFVLYGEE